MSCELTCKNHLACWPCSGTGAKNGVLRNNPILRRKKCHLSVPLNATSWYHSMLDPSQYTIAYVYVTTHVNQVQVSELST